MYTNSHAQVQKLDLVALSRFLSLGHQSPQLAKKFKTLHNRPENLKKSSPKKTREINFTKKVFDQISFFAISHMAKNNFLNWEKFKTGKNAISRKKIL